jgi:hypothetical protein
MLDDKRAVVDSAYSSGAAASSELRALSKARYQHPLEPWVQYAASRGAYVREHLHDYTCLLVKRERIEGRLSQHQYLALKVRLGKMQGDRPTVPLSVYVQYLSPRELRGRKALYVAGRNDGKMLVRVGAGRFRYLRLRLNPDSGVAKRESNYSITELGIDTIIERLLEQAESDVATDPGGENTVVSRFRDARVNDRLCKRIRIVHPRRQDGLVFHIADVYVDEELELPIRVAGYDWPDNEGGSALLEEFTFTRLRINVGLTDEDFSPSLLGSPASRRP